MLSATSNNAPLTGAYFFLLPNGCFPLFPVVDVTTFERTYADDDRLRIAQSGGPRGARLRAAIPPGQRWQDLQHVCQYGPIFCEQAVSSAIQDRPRLQP